MAVLVAFPGAFAGHGYVRQRPGVCRKSRETTHMRRLFLPLRAEICKHPDAACLCRG